jgi:hypothetical protein
MAATAACATQPTEQPPSPEDLLGAQEALFRHQIARVAPPGSEYSTVCISTLGFRPAADPPPQIVARLRDVHPPVKPWSGCRWNDVRPVDVATGHPAVQVAQTLTCSDADHCKGSGGYAYGNLGANSFDHRLERKNGRWPIGELMTGVS